MLSTRRQWLLLGCGIGLCALVLGLSRARFGAIDALLWIAAMSSLALGATMRAKGAPSARGRWILGLMSVAYSLAVIGCWACAFLLIGPRLPERDLTAAGLNTISGVGRRWLEQLGVAVHIVAFPAEGQADALIEEFDRLKRINSHITYELLDPLRDQARALELGDNIFQGDVFVTSGAKRRRIQTLGRLPEADIVNAMVAVVREGPSTIYMLTGHNEYTMTAPDPTSGIMKSRADAQRAEQEALMRSSSDLVNALMRRGLDVQLLDLSAVASVPADALMILAIGPTSDLSTEEAESLAAYLSKGGRFLFAAGLGAFGAQGRLDTWTRWRSIIEPFGVVVEDALVVDLVGLKRYKSEMIAVASYQRGGEPIPPDAPQFQGLVFPRSRGIGRIIPEPPGVASAALFSSSDESHLVSLEALASASGAASVDPERGAPRPLMIQSRRNAPDDDPEKSSRVLLIGSAVLASDASTSAASLGVLVGAIEEMTNDKLGHFLPIPTRALDDHILALEAPTWRFLSIFHQLFLPGVILFGGLAIIVLRRDE